MRPAPARSPDALRSFIAYGFLHIRIAGHSIGYRFVDEAGRIRDQVRQRVR